MPPKASGFDDNAVLKLSFAAIALAIGWLLIKPKRNHEPAQSQAAAGAGAGAAAAQAAAHTQMSSSAATPAPKCHLTRASELSDYVEEWTHYLTVDQKKLNTYCAMHTAFVNAVTTALKRKGEHDVTLASAGSFAKGTQIGTKRVDFDTLIVFDRYADKADLEKSADAKCAGDPVSSSRFVKALHDAVKSVCAEQKSLDVKYHPNSATVKFAHFDVDLLPAIHASDKRTGLYLIAAEKDGWYPSYTFFDVRSAEHLGAQSTIKIVKHLWHKHVPFYKVPSVVIEWSASPYASPGGEDTDTIFDGHWQQAHASVYRVLSIVHRKLKEGKMMHRFIRNENLLADDNVQHRQTAMVVLEQLMLDWRTAMQNFDAVHLHAILTGSALRVAAGSGQHFPTLYVRKDRQGVGFYHFCAHAPCPAGACDGLTFGSTKPSVPAAR